MPTVNFNTHLPNYEVLAELGRGNTRVLKARHLPSGDVVAIKQYAFATDADTLRRFERESQIMTRIDHPNIVRVHEVQLGAAMPYVVMDFVEGGDLRGLIRQQGHLDIPTTIRLGLQLTGAFRAMHPMQVVHRDIKPENVLYRRLASGELHFLLTDFGIAKLRTDDNARTRTGQSLMTYEYAAPEQFDNPRHVDEAADYYALGVVLYECLTGSVPFVLQDETGLAWFMRQVLTAPLPAPALPSGQPLPPSLTTLLASLLIRNPSDRLHNSDQVELLLEQSRVEQLRNRSGQNSPISLTQTVAGPVVTSTYAGGVTHEPEPTSQQLAEPVRSVNWTFWGSALTVLAVGLVFSLYSHQPRQSPDTAQRTHSTAQTDSVYQTVDSAQTMTEPAANLPTAELNNEEAVDNQINTELPYSISADSTDSGSMTVVADSVASVPTDTTQ